MGRTTNEETRSMYQYKKIDAMIKYQCLAHIERLQNVEKNREADSRLEGKKRQTEKEQERCCNRRFKRKPEKARQKTEKM